MSVSYPYWSIAQETGLDYGLVLEFVETLVPAEGGAVFSPVAWADRMPLDARIRLIRAFRSEHDRQRTVTKS